MKIRPKDNGSTEWYCTRCGGTENLQGRLTGGEHQEKRMQGGIRYRITYKICSVLRRF